MFCCAGRAGTESGVGGAGEATIAGVESGTAAGIAAEITALRSRPGERERGTAKSFEVDSPEALKGEMATVWRGCSRH